MQPGKAHASLKGSAEGLHLTEEEKQIQIDRMFNSSQRGPNHKEADLNFKHSQGFVVSLPRGLGGPITQMKTRWKKLS